MLLKEFLEPLAVSQVDAAMRMDIPFQRLNAIVKGRRGVSAETALLLEALTGCDAQIWLALQAKWDLWHAMKGRGGRLKEGGSGGGTGMWRRGRMRQGLIVALVALALVLLVSAGLFIRTLDAARAVDPGFGARTGLVGDRRDARRLRRGPRPAALHPPRGRRSRAAGR
jgi:addiction module HigA family antidote